MAGLGIRLYSDEMISRRLSRELRRRGYDAESCWEAGRSDQGISDEDQLLYAVQQGRTILTFDNGDFAELEARMKAEGRRHAGIMLSPRIDDVGELLRCIQRHLDRVEPSVQDDTLLWLDTSRDF